MADMFSLGQRSKIIVFQERPRSRAHSLLDRSGAVGTRRGIGLNANDLPGSPDHVAPSLRLAIVVVGQRRIDTGREKFLAVLDTPLCQYE